MGNIEEISERIISARRELDAINLINVHDATADTLVALEVRKANARIALNRAKRAYDNYVTEQSNINE